jgi:predicted transcriptional regulator
MPEEDEPAEEPAEEEQSGPDHPLDDAEYLREAYHGDAVEEGGATQARIGEEHGVTSSTVSHYMKKYDIETTGNTVSDERLDDPEWLREKYVDEELTMQEIADIVGCSDGTVMRRLHRVEGLEVRRSTVGQSADEGDDEAEEAEEAEPPEADD